MDLDLLVKKALASGIESIQINSDEAVIDSIQVFNDTLQKVQSSKVSTLEIEAIVDGKKSIYYMENLNDENIDNIIEKLKTNVRNVDSEDVQIFSDNKKKYPVKDIDEINVDYGKLKSELFSINDELRKIDKRLVNFETWVFVKNGREKIINSNGLDVEMAENLAYCFIKTICEENGKQYKKFRVLFANKLEELDILNLSKKVLEECLAKIGAETIETNDYEIILPEDVVAELLETALDMFEAESVQKNSSILKGKLNTEIVSPKITLVEDPNNDKYIVSRYFDSEGTETYYKEIIKEGILTTYLYDLKTALKDGVKSTGNGYAGYSCQNLYIKPGDKSFDDMISETKKGILVTAVQGLHAGFNKINGDFSLQIQGQYIENGKNVKPITLMIMSGNFFEMLKNVESVGDKVDFTLDTNIGGTALKIKSLTVSGE